MKNHIFLMFYYALLCSLFFSHYWANGKKAVIKEFLKLMAYMIIGGIATAWFLYFFPIK